MSSFWHLSHLRWKSAEKISIPLPVTVKQTSSFGSNLFRTIHAHISVRIPFFFVLAITRLLTDNTAEHIPSPGEQIPEELIIEVPHDTMSVCQPWQKAVVILPATETLNIKLDMRKWLPWPVNKYTEVITRNTELECLYKKCFELKSAEYSAKNTGFNDLGELHLYNLLGMGIWASWLPSLSLHCFVF